MFESKHRSGALRLAGTFAALLLGPLAPGLMGCGISYEFEPATVGDDQAGRAPEPRTNSQFIRAVYVDILGRAPEVYDFSIEDDKGKELIKFPIQEQANLVGALDSTGDPDALRAIITAGLLGSSEVDLPSKSSVDDPQAFIRDKFRALLGREPNTYEAFAFEDAWKNDAAAGPRTVIRAIVGSREYQSR